MGSQKPDERHYMVELDIQGERYRSELWRASLGKWILLEVVMQSGDRHGGIMQSFTTLKGALLCAEQIALKLLAAQK